MGATDHSLAAATTPVLMPQMGLEVASATVLALHAAVGDQVAEGQPLVEVETDKAITEIEAPCAGFIVAIEVEEGQEVPVGAVVAHIGDDPQMSPTKPGVTPAQSARAPARPTASADPIHRPDPDTANVRVRAAPIARRVAAAQGLELSSVTGTGPRGRITLRDVEQALAKELPPETSTPVRAPAEADPSPDVLPLSKVRSITARRMTQSQLIPQYLLQREIDATHLLAQKDAVAAGATSGARAGVNDLLIQAIAETVIRHPVMSTSFVETPVAGLRRHPTVGVGLAVATERGLMVPVISGADALGLAEIAAARTQLVQAARVGRLAPEQMSGASVTLSNLGGFGVDRFTAMLNPGESAILAVGRISDRVVPRGRGIAIVATLTLSVSVDHRIIDGADGAAALATLAELLEGRMTWRP